MKRRLAESQPFQTTRVYRPRQFASLKDRNKNNNKISPSDRRRSRKEVDVEFIAYGGSGALLAFTCMKASRRRGPTPYRDNSTVRSRAGITRRTGRGVALVRFRRIPQRVSSVAPKLIVRWKPRARWTSPASMARSSYRAVGDLRGSAPLENKSSRVTNARLRRRLPFWAHQLSKRESELGEARKYHPDVRVRPPPRPMPATAEVFSAGGRPRSSGLTRWWERPSLLRIWQYTTGLELSARR